MYVNVYVRGSLVLGAPAVVYSSDRLNQHNSMQHNTLTIRVCPSFSSRENGQNISPFLHDIEMVLPVLLGAQSIAIQKASLICYEILTRKCTETVC